MQRVWIISVLLSLVAGSARGELRTLASKHLTLHTDMAADPEIDALPGLFDQAFEGWCAYFGVDPREHTDWHVTGCLLRGPESRERFIAQGLMPADLWEFKSGYSMGDRLWFYDQIGAPYYRRHLLLHEGVHCFMNSVLGSAGPPWYGEGMAELLGTHKLEDGKLTVNYFPRSPKDVPKLGRIEMVRKEVAAGRFMTLKEIFNYGPTAHRQNEPYGWCWAAAAFFDGKPELRERFRKSARKFAAGEPFDLDEVNPAEKGTLEEQWRAFIANLNYGYDFNRQELELQRGKPVDGSAITKVDTSRGWQSSGILLEAGKTYRIAAKGRYRVAETSKPWWSEPNGVTIRYVHGKPLGLLLGAIRADDNEQSATTAFANPISIGTGTTITPESTGTLYLRINDAPGELADNEGTVTVGVKLLSTVHGN